MKVAIVGSRDFPYLHMVRYYVSNLPRDTVVISGGARGVDQAAVEAAKIAKLETLVFMADWTTGRGAGYARNVLLVKHADKIVAFWDGKSKGTKHTIDLAKKAGKPIEIHQV